MKNFINNLSDKMLDGLVWLSKFVFYNLAIFLSFLMGKTRELGDKLKVDDSWASLRDDAAAAFFMTFMCPLIFLFVMAQMAWKGLYTGFGYLKGLFSK